MTNNLSRVLLRFRELKVAMVADIKCMFHQVKVSSEDRDALRFLWWKDRRLEDDPQVYRMKVHLFEAASSPSCACFSLLQAADLLGPESSKQAMEAVRTGFYVDDLLISVSSVEEAKTLATDVTRMLVKAGFTLTK